MTDDDRVLLSGVIATTGVVFSMLIQQLGPGVVDGKAFAARLKATADDAEDRQPTDEAGRPNVGAFLLRQIAQVIENPGPEWPPAYGGMRDPDQNAH